MTQFKRKGDQKKYLFCHPDCIGRACWSPGTYRHYGTSLSGAKSCTGETACCVRNFNHGCPDNLDTEYPVDLELVRQRKRDGWKRV